jgi:hypothetical protein
VDKLILQEGARETSKPARRRPYIEQVRAQLRVPERRACAALGQQPILSSLLGNMRQIAGVAAHFRRVRMKMVTSSPNRG